MENEHKDCEENPCSACQDELLEQAEQYEREKYWRVDRDRIW